MKEKHHKVSKAIGTQANVFSSLLCTVVFDRTSWMYPRLRGWVPTFLSPLGLFTVDGSVSIPALASPLASENSINSDMVTGDAFANMAGPDSPIDQVQALEQMRVDLLEPKLGKVLKGFN